LHLPTVILGESLFSSPWCFFFHTPALSILFPYITPPLLVIHPSTLFFAIQLHLTHSKMMLKTNPPLLHHYQQVSNGLVPPPPPPAMEECQLPLIDLSGLSSCNERARTDCEAAICRASSEWGFFQVVSHGIHRDLVSKMKEEQLKLFQLPFDKKVNSGLLNNSYRWGTPTATCPKQFSWSEAFHVPLSMISQEDCYGEFTSLRKVMVEFAGAMSKLAGVLAGVLAENLGHSSGNFADICQESSCFLRLNRYPACPMSPEIFGLVPHTDSDFLTILSQDQVGGLQLMKDSRWVAVKPNQDALIVNIGDLFQVRSRNLYQSDF
ncbi:Gibberellin 2-beta-dioxygenase 6, partial [Linum grandiflorum]